MASGATGREMMVCEVREADEATAHLIGLAQGGDRAALAALVESYRPLMASAARSSRPAKRLPTVDDDDLRQEAAKAFIELVREYRADLGPAGVYLKRKLAWRLANYVRAERRRSGLRCALPSRPPTSARGKPAPAAPGTRLAGVHLQALLRRLTPRQRAVIHKHHWEDKNTAEVARELGVTLQAVTALRRRAEQALKRGLLNEGGSKDGGP